MRDDFKEGMDSIASFIERMIKVMKDLYSYIKEQLESFNK